MSESANGRLRPSEATRRAAQERDKVRSAELAAERAKVIGQAVERLAEVLGSRYSPERVRLEDYRVYAGEPQAFALRAARTVAARAREFIEAGRTLGFYGTHGTGKDHLLAACLYAAARAGYSVGWVDAQDLFARLRDAIGTRQAKEPILLPLAKPRVLGISDPIPSSGSADDYSLNDLRRLIDRRDREGKVTWFTSNISTSSAQEVENALRACNRAALDKAYRLAQAELESALSGAVWSRLSQGAVMPPCFWKDYRKRKFGEAIPCTIESTAIPALTDTTVASVPASMKAPRPR